MVPSCLLMVQRVIWSGDISLNQNVDVEQFEHDEKPDEKGQEKLSKPLFANNRN